MLIKSDLSSTGSKFSLDSVSPNIVTNDESVEIYSYPSARVAIVDVPEVSNVETTFTYNFFKKDERVIYDENRRAPLIERDYSGLDKLPRYITINFKQPAARDSITINDSIKIKDYIGKIVLENNISSNSTSTIEFQDIDVEENFYNLMQNATHQSATPNDIMNSMSKPALAKYMAQAMSNMQAQGISYAQTDMQDQYVSDEFKPLKNLKLNTTFHNAILGSVIHNASSDPSSPFCNELTSIAHRASGITDNFISKNDPAVLELNDFETTMKYIKKTQIDSTETIIEGSKLLGYIIDKYEIVPASGVIQQRLLKRAPIIIEGRHINTVIDPNVRYGGKYRYNVRAIVLSRFKAISVNSNDYTDTNIVEALSLISSRGSQFSELVCSESRPPPEPENLLFKYDFKKDALMVSWDFPLNTQQDIKRFQIFRRKTIYQPFELIREYDFDNSVIRASSLASGEKQLIKRKAFPSTIYFDSQFNEMSKYIYAVASIDARGLTSGYSAQFEVSYDRFKNKTITKYISSSGAPKPYPNINLQLDAFPDVIKDTGHKSMEIYFDPEYLKVSKNNEDLNIIRKSGNSGENKYKIQIINTDLQKSKLFEFSISEKITIDEETGLEELLTIY